MILPRRPPLRWTNAPLFPLALAAVAGLLLAHRSGYVYPAAAFGIATASVITALALSFRGSASRWPGRLSSLLLAGGVAALYYFLAAFTHPPHQSDHFAHHFFEDGVLVLQVEEVKAGRTRLRVVGEVVAATDSVTGAPRPVSGQLLAYLHPDLKGGRLRRGDRLTLRGRVTTIEGRKNPLAFDPAQYWGSRGIYHQLFVREPGDYSIEKGTAHGLRNYAHQLRQRWKAQFRPYLTNDNYAVAIALILGDRDDLSQEIKSAYTDTGAVHVLAVSGLHVGIIALLFSWLIGRVPLYTEWWRWVAALLVLAGIWGFALVTGLSSSVQRAAFMFSLLIVGKRLYRRTSTFNLLALSALVMLASDPKQVLAVGFQLSYSAVAGILVFARPLGRTVHFAVGALEKIKDGIAVSVAAQLGTLPLSLFHFRQFPLYFMLSGSLVVFFAFGVLCLGLLHGFLASIPGLEALLPLSGGALNWLLYLQNGFINLFHGLPNGVVYFEAMGSGRLLLLSSIIVSLGLWLYWRRAGYFYALLGQLILLLLIWAIGVAYPQRADRFVIYDVARSSVLDVVCGGELYALGRAADERSLGYAAGGLRDVFASGDGAYELTEKSLSTTCTVLEYPYLRVFDRVVMILDGEDNKMVTVVPDFVDVAWVRGGYRIENVATYPARVGFLFVVDASNRYGVRAAWRAAGYPVHDTREMGAYMYFPVN